MCPNVSPAFRTPKPKRAEKFSTRRKANNRRRRRRKIFEKSDVSECVASVPNSKTQESGEIFDTPKSWAPPCGAQRYKKKAARRKASRTTGAKRETTKNSRPTQQRPAPPRTAKTADTHADGQSAKAKKTSQPTAARRAAASGKPTTPTARTTDGDGAEEEPTQAQTETNTDSAAAERGGQSDLGSRAPPYGAARMCYFDS